MPKAVNVVHNNNCQIFILIVEKYYRVTYRLVRMFVKLIKIIIYSIVKLYFINEKKTENFLFCYVPLNVL